jgi:hypothetical protein
LLVNHSVFITLFLVDCLVFIIDRILFLVNRILFTSTSLHVNQFVIRHCWLLVRVVIIGVLGLSSTSAIVLVVFSSPTVVVTTFSTSLLLALVSLRCYPLSCRFHSYSHAISVHNCIHFTPSSSCLLGHDATLRCVCG